MNRANAFGMNVSYDRVAAGMTLPDVYYSNPLAQPLLYGATEPLVYDMCVNGNMHAAYVLYQIGGYIINDWGPIICDNLRYFRDFYRVESAVLALASLVCAAIPECAATGAPAILLDSAAYVFAVSELLAIIIQKKC